MFAKQFLNQPVYFFSTLKKKRTYLFSAIGFALFFLVIYMPFGLHNAIAKSTFIPERLFFFISSELLAILIVLYISQFIILKPYINQPITLKNQLGIFFLEMFGISALQTGFNFSFVLLFLPKDLFTDLISAEFTNRYIQDYHIPPFIYEGPFSDIPQILVLGFPFIGCLLYFYRKELKHDVNELESKLNHFKSTLNNDINPSETVNLLDENNQIECQLTIGQILMIESNNQYVLVYYLNKEQTICKHIIRTRLKKILDELSHISIQQCHRSYAVNLMHILKLNHLNKKHLLTLSPNHSLKIPVSKTYLPHIKTTLTHTMV